MGALPRLQRLGAGVLVALVLLGLTACTGGMSPQVRQAAVPVEGLAQIRRDVDAFIGRTVILGGEIIEVRNESMEETTLLILQRPLGLDRRPNLGGESEGRFMVRFDRYLDPEVFRKGLAVTVGGVVEGTVTEPVGKAPYRYVLLQGRDLHGWRSYDGYYYDPYWDLPLYYHPYPYYGRFRFHGAYGLP